MDISGLFGKIRRLADENSPVILTGMAVAGAGLSTFFGAKAAYKAAGVIREADAEAQRISPISGEVEPYSLSTAEKALLTWKLYVPAAATLAGTSACMIMATKIGLDRTAAMAGALVVSERTYDQYKEKVKETLGDNKHTKIIDGVAQDQVEKATLPPVILSDGKQLCYDMWSGRFFQSTIEELKQAENQINHELIYGAHASLSQFYARIGLDPIQQSDDIGWNNKHLLGLDYSTVLKDNKPCIAITFDQEPRPRFQFDGSSVDD